MSLLMGGLFRLAEEGTTPGAVAAVCISGDGRHSGIGWWDEETGETRMIHQTLMGQVDRACPADFPNGLRWVVSQISDWEMKFVMRDWLDRWWARSLRDPVPVPFGFDMGASFKADLTLTSAEDPGGVSCSLFVAKMFAYVNLPLVDLATWCQASSDRRDEDRAAAEGLLRHMEVEDRVRAEELRAVREVVRLRPVEVAAASGMRERPVDYARAAPAGAELMSQLVGRAAAPPSATGG